MIVRISEKTGEIELAGNAKELNFLSRQLSIDHATVSLEHKNLNPFPYSKNLESIRIRHYPERLVKISVEGESLLIEGSPEKLRILSENLEANGNEPEGYHLHIEHFDDHFYLSNDSAPLVVSFG